MGARPWLAHSQADYAGMLLARGQSDDLERARELADEAVVIYAEMGMDAWAERLRGLTR
jgi:hypothetical protein